MSTPRLPRHRRRLTVMLGGKLPALSADVSAGGFCAEMTHVFLPGSKIHGTIELGPSEYDFEGEVTWARAGDPRLSTRSRIGVRFTRISTEFQQFFLRQETRPLVRWHT